MRGDRPSRASLREVKREHRKRRRARHLTLVQPPDPKRRPGRILKPLLAAVLVVTAIVMWKGLPPPPPSQRDNTVMYFTEER